MSQIRRKNLRNRPQQLLKKEIIEKIEYVPDEKFYSINWWYADCRWLVDVEWRTNFIHIWYYLVLLTFSDILTMTFPTTIQCSFNISIIISEKETQCLIRSELDFCLSFSSFPTVAPQLGAARGV